MKTLATLNRRTLLRGASGIAVALPFLQAMRPRRAHALGGPKRFVVFYSANGSNNPEQMHPTGGSESNFTLGQELAPLELAGLKPNCLFLSGLNNSVAMKYVKGGDVDLHCIGAATWLTSTAPSTTPDFDRGTLQKIGLGGNGTCWGTSISLDQEIARQIGAATRFRSLELGVRTNIELGTTPFGFLSWSGPSKPVPREDDPKKAFARLFSDPGSGQTGAPAIGIALKQRRSVLDFVRGEYQSLCAQLGAADKYACDAHFQSIREVEKRFDMVPAGTGKACTAPALTPIANHMLVENMPAVGRQQMDILALALACDLTRVASLQWSYARSVVTHSWAGSRNGHHNASHNNGDPDIQRINVWYAQQLAYLAGKLKENGILDDSLIYFGSDVAESTLHGFTNSRCTLVGGCGGAFRTGRWLRFNGEDSGRLNISILNTMGIRATTFGEVQGGPLPNLA